ncbi:MAG: hypothetical protein NW205_03960, partial [Hyphomicrobiaceae bacterium]|nr:hypothetical protein [Hyphomicrobiaceae bacterium]
MRGPELKVAVAGATLALDSPIGIALPIVFAHDGTMTSEAGTLSFLLGSSRDVGRWWIAGDKLCKRWQVWFENKTKCVWVGIAPDNRITWRHADG